MLSLLSASDDDGRDVGASGSGALMVSGSSASWASRWPAVEPAADSVESADGAADCGGAVSNGSVTLPGGCQYSGTSGSPLVAQ